MICFLVFHLNSKGNFEFIGQFHKRQAAYNSCWSVLNVSHYNCESFLIYYFINAWLQYSDYCEFTNFNCKKRINHIHKHYYQTISEKCD